MMPSELSRISRSATAIGPFGSSTPSVQPPSAATPIRTTASKPYRMSDHAEVNGAACAADGAWQELGMHRPDGTASMRDTHEREWISAMVDQESRKQHEQIEDG